MDDILELLNRDGFVSGEELSRRLHITRAAVWKRIHKLRAQGYDIAAAGKKGYTLIPQEDSLLPGILQKDLSTAWAGRPPILYEEEMTSTNTVLRHAAEQGAENGTAALCETQSGGKGRMGRTWTSPRGEGIWTSLLVRPKLPPLQAPLITLAAALAMAKAVEGETGLSPQIKWPNDLVLSGKKICGILLELSSDMDAIHYVVVGTGLNVGKNAFPPEIAHRATSLEAELGRKVSRAAILRAYWHEMETAMALLEEKGLKGILADYEKRSCTLNSRVRVQGTVEMEGIAVSMDDSGALLVKDDQGTVRRILAGDVSVRGVMGYV